MTASSCIGRVGSLAVALGIGAAAFSTAAIAAADPSSPDASNPSSTNTSATGSAAPDSPATAPSTATGRGTRSAFGTRSAKGTAPAPRAAAATASGSNAPAVNAGDAPSRPTASPRRNRAAAAAAAPSSAASAEAASTTAASEAGSAPTDRVTNPAAPAAPVTLPALSPLATAVSLPALSPNPALASATTAVSKLLPLLSRISQAHPHVMTAAPAAAVAAPTNALASANAVTSTTKLTPAEAFDLVRSLVVLAATAVAQMGVVMAVSLSTIAPPSPLKAAPELVLNGYNLVPSTPEDITSLYGRWTYLPGAPSLIQGAQQFNVVDPTTSATVGTFDALVSRGNGYNYQELLVTANDGINVGTDAGQTPPVGSLIATMKFAKNIGWSYSAMPTPSGQDLVSFKLLTPFGDIPMKINFDAAKGIADHTIDDRPMDLMNGYAIAPTNPTGEILTATSGILPLFTTVQGHQNFSVYDTNGAAVGSFDGVFTTTFDIIGGGIGTQAVLVTANDGTNVGTGAGQVPPVGSVYNIMYIGDVTYIYSALPAPSGNVVSLLEKTATGKVLTSPVTLIDAATPPKSASEPLTTPDGYTFVPISDVVHSGVNGLPPREVEVQGYQQFDVYNSAGTKVGTVDADVASQWDLFGVYSNAIMVTKVTSGTAGTDPANVPPVGSIYSFVNPGNGGFGTVHSTVPAASGDVSSYMVKTPLGNIKFPSTTTTAAGRVPTLFFSPF